MPRGFRPDGSLSKAANGEWADGSPSRLATVAAMTVDHQRLGDRYASPLPQVLVSKLVFEDCLDSRSLDNSAYGQ
jgi:hypothetical protein